MLTKETLEGVQYAQRLLNDQAMELAGRLNECPNDDDRKIVSYLMRNNRKASDALSLILQKNFDEKNLKGN